MVAQEYPSPSDYGSIEREVHVDASPDVVFDVISRPEHIREWWSANTALEPAVGSSGELTWRDEQSGRVDVAAITVVEVDRPRRFAFRWTHEGGPATSTNSLLVTFTLTPSGSGTILHLLETGFRQRGWDLAVLEHTYQDHVTGWEFLLPRIAARAAGEAPA
jgi:uncharacterized protein YndB with AHSA1/START domain